MLFMENVKSNGNWGYTTGLTSLFGGFQCLAMSHDRIASWLAVDVCTAYQPLSGRHLQSEMIFLRHGNFPKTGISQNVADYSMQHELQSAFLLPREHWLYCVVLDLFPGRV